MQRSHLLANTLSLLRIPLGAAVILTFDHPVRYVFFALAALTDWLDGLAARGLRQESRFGAWLDPVCDKIFVTAIVGYGYLEYGLSPVELGSFFLRDLFTVAASFALLITGKTRKLQVKARWSGKVVMFFQFCAVLLLLAHEWTLLPPMLAVIAVCSVWSIVDYSIAGWKQLRSR